MSFSAFWTEKIDFVSRVSPFLLSVAAITGGFIRHCNRCAYGLTAARRAGPSMQTLGPLLQYTGCTKQRYTSYRGYLLTYLPFFNSLTLLLNILSAATEIVNNIIEKQTTKH